MRKKKIRRSNIEEVIKENCDEISSIKNNKIEDYIEWLYWYAYYSKLKYSHYLLKCWRIHFNPEKSLIDTFLFLGFFFLKGVVWSIISVRGTIEIFIFLFVEINLSYFLFLNLENIILWLIRVLFIWVRLRWFFLQSKRVNIRNFPNNQIYFFAKCKSTFIYWLLFFQLNFYLHLNHLYFFHLKE